MGRAIHTTVSRSTVVQRRAFQRSGFDYLNYTLLSLFVPSLSVPRVYTRRRLMKMMILSKVTTILHSYLSYCYSDRTFNEKNVQQLSLAIFDSRSVDQKRVLNDN